MEALIMRFLVAGNLLDVGCGSGGHFLDLPSSIVPHGIEIDPDASELARSRAAERGGHIIQADALSGLQSMPAAEMKGIVMHSFLEHDVRPLEVLQAAERVLCGDGALIIKVPNFACWNHRYWHGTKWPGFRYPDHVNYFTPQTLSQIVSKAGLRTLRFAWRDRIPTNDNMWLVAGKSR
jgi:SAM-dependent methyltransferase